MSGDGYGPGGCTSCPIAVNISATFDRSPFILSRHTATLYGKAAPQGASCPQQPLSFLWEVFSNSAPLPLPNGTSTFAHSLVVPPSTLPTDATASFRLTVCYAEQPTPALCGSQTVAAPVRSGPLAALISGGNVTLGSGSAVRLDGAASSDPDGIPGPLSFLWACAVQGSPAGTPCAAPDGSPAQFDPTAPSISVPLAGGAGGTTYAFTLQVSKDVRVSAATATVTVVQGSPPVVFIPAAPQAVNPSKRVSVLASVSSTAPPASLSTLWTVTSGPPLNLSDPAIVATPPSSAGLVFVPNALSPGSTHVLRLTASDSNGVGFAEVTLAVAPTPWSPPGSPSPTLSVSPAAGVALVTHFTVSTAGWDPTDGALQYQLSVVVPGSGGAPSVVSTDRKSVV